MSIMTVLLVLSLTLFSALTLSSARADLALSRRNADTVAAYYAADGQAVRLYAEFAAGSQEELEAEIPVTQRQSLRLHLLREADGSVRILEWRTLAAEEVELDEHLPVWDGTLPSG